MLRIGLNAVCACSETRSLVSDFILAWCPNLQWLAQQHVAQWTLVRADWVGAGKFLFLTNWLCSSWLFPISLNLLCSSSKSSSILWSSHDQILTKLLILLSVILWKSSVEFWYFTTTLLIQKDRFYADRFKIGTRGGVGLNWKWLVRIVKCIWSWSSVHFENISHFLTFSITF